MSEMNFYALTSSDFSELKERFQGEGPFAVGNAEFDFGTVDGVPTVVLRSAGEAVAVALGETWNELVSKDTNGQTYNCD